MQLSWCLLLPALASFPPSLVTSAPLNVLLILVDDLRPALRCYGDRQAVTPNMDALAAESALFSRAYAQQALCGPSRTSLLTSRRPGTTRLFDTGSYWREAAGNFTSLPQMLRESGYHTASMGKVFHPGIVSNHSDDQPYSWSETPYHPPSEKFKNSPVCLGPDGELHANLYCPVDPATQPLRTLPDIQTADRAARWLEERGAEAGGSQPWLLAVGLHKPHIPLKMPMQYLDLHPPDSVVLPVHPRRPDGLPAVAWNPWCDVRRRDDVTQLNVTFPYGQLPDWYSRSVRQAYAAAVSYADDLVGRLLQALARSGTAHNTAVVLAGDHGWSLGERGEWAKYSTSEDATRTVLMVHVPSVTGSLAYFRHKRPAPRPGKDEGLPHGKGGSDTGAEGDGENTLVPGENAPETEFRDNDRSSNMINPPDGNIENRSALHPRKLQSDSVGTSGRPGSPCRVDTPVELLDIMPTVAEAALGLQLPSCPRSQDQPQLCTQGRSLVGLIHQCVTDRNRRTPGRGGPGRYPSRRHPNDLERRQLLFKFRVPSRDLPGPNYIGYGFRGTQTHVSSGENVGNIYPSLNRNSSNVLTSNSHHPAETKQFGPPVSRFLQPCGSLLPLSSVAAAFSQYPRPSIRPQVNSDQPRLKNIRYMGYSVRTERYRYTAWVEYNPERFKAHWDRLAAEELYDHETDQYEAVNLAAVSRCRRLKEQLKVVLRDKLGLH